MPQRKVYITSPHSQYPRNFHLPHHPTYKQKMATNTKPTPSTTSNLSATATIFDPLSSLKAELAAAEAHLTNLKASFSHAIYAALGEESCCDPIEEYLAIKTHDRLVATQLFHLEEEREQIRQWKEWNEIEKILEIGRESFRAEMKMEDVQSITIGFETQFEEIEREQKLLIECGEQVQVSDEEMKEYHRVQERKFLGNKMKVKLADSIARRARLAHGLTS
ncbi:uncharacterized protein LY89DRAFT_119526 [Mollisia scopiformis]|uniref:Uncharacterized protein n=1 Tax=Mollisia scopiformis TaxID=149040 RepID=A0A194X3E3_MOLSC|nr:uncharacterized protein LY89DRAFT_119526 [Mollisia scopiformis]KUJ14686.1 hypothetical protein LY89DRAFT_119526 [Mollisia scopiformis]